MPDFNAARKNMVDCQIHPSGVVSPAILNAFSDIPRESFAPANMQGVAYMDESLPLGGGRFLLEPITHARMVQAVSPAVSDRVLDIGGATGYSAAILGKLAGEVIALEHDAALLKAADALWGSLGLSNIIPAHGALADGSARHEPFDLIFMNGSVQNVPASLLDQLSDGGRLITIIRAEGAQVGDVTVFKKSGQSCTSLSLFESGCPFLPGFEPKTAFSF